MAQHPSSASDDARRARARRQLLDGEGHDVGAVVSALVGVQAQELRAAALSIRARTAGLCASDVDAALQKNVVVTWSMRGTRHMHHVDDVRWLLALFGPQFRRQPRREKQLGIDGALGDRAVRALEKAVARGPLARSAMKDVLEREGVDVTGQAPIHIVARAALEGALCIVPGRDELYVALDDRVPGGSTTSRPGSRSTSRSASRSVSRSVSNAALDPERGAAALLRRYLAAYAPATKADFAAWSGLPAALVKRAFDDVAAELDAIDLPAGTALALRSHEAAASSRSSRSSYSSYSSHPSRSSHSSQDVSAARGALPLRLAGGFDNLVLAYADRSLHIAGADGKAVNAGGGLVRPIVVDDGVVVATWKIAAGKVTVAPLRSLTAKQRAAIDVEIADVQRFLAA